MREQPLILARLSRKADSDILSPMDTIVVTGGAGFIGSNFVRLALADTPDRVVVVDKLTYSGHRASLQDVEKDPRFTFVEADIADKDAMRAVLANFRPRAILNFAAETHVDRSLLGDADPVVREQRRLQQRNLPQTASAAVAAELGERDRRDRTRAASPLVAAPDALVLDSSRLSEDEVLARVEALVQQKLG